MSPYVRFGEILRRMATVTSVIRTRQEDAQRSELAGGPSPLDARVAEVVARLEKNLSDLEKALA